MKSLAYREVESYAKEKDKGLLVAYAEHGGLFCDVVIVNHYDGSMFMFDSATVEDYRSKMDDDIWVIVFTEHHGTHIYPWDDLSGVRVLKDSHWHPKALLEEDEPCL